MKRRAAMLAGVLCTGMSMYSQSAPVDSVKTVNLDEVQIISTRATSKTPVAFTDVDKEQIRKQNFGLDIPFLLTSTPSVLTTSDAGAGIGYTSIRVRGTDATRINITANGIPMNDAESHSIFWVNTPDMASSLEDMQIQRGAGTSTNGAGAFGASINMRTQGISSKPYAEVSGSYGSFNTHKETLKVGTGILNNHWAFDARISNISTDGYRDRATADMTSYFLQGGYYGESTSIKFITFGGNEETYHAWDGISKDDLKNNRKYNPNGKIEDANGNVIGFYDNQIDKYKQTHYQLLLDHTFTPAWKLNVALHYTDGDGYYEEYKNTRKLIEYGLEPFTVDGKTIKKVDLVRRKSVESGFGGGIFSLNYTNERLQAAIGGGINYYENDHYGNVIWIKNYIGNLAPDHEYYRNTGKKTDGNIYAKANYELGNGFNLYADLQYRHINYKINGNNDKWDDTKEPEHLQRLDIDEKFSFFNPKAGIFWQINPNHSAYASFSVAQKEPTRNNYTDGLFTELPKAEKLFDYELGYTYRNSRFTAGVNLYYMDYTDQLVLNGKVNEIGEAMAENVKDSYRMGIELTAGAKLLEWLRWDVNATWSKNRIKNYTAYYSTWDSNWNEYDQTAVAMGTTPIAFSPSFMAGSLFSFDYKGWGATFQSQYVSRQYLDNTGNEVNSIDPYFVNNLHVGYTFKLKGFKSINVGATVYNLFNEKYETNGYSASSATYDPESETTTINHNPMYYPMAGTNILCNVTLRF
ncbi:TonB-dependent receptor [Bacteroides sp. 519]|uniref:TonB-dependent receptor n=1 Tax=Bacteroides sp. 519 TaxID=2302937 RepID=UPI0013D356B4|nr:TonB-dependent receptor [Bacteroides sp. 519]NDV58876.1 TonB-dependent receptor [Bacteroides sp. 519]